MFTKEKKTKRRRRREPTGERGGQGEELRSERNKAKRIAAEDQGDDSDGTNSIATGERTPRDYRRDLHSRVQNDLERGSRFSRFSRGDLAVRFFTEVERSWIVRKCGVRLLDLLEKILIFSEDVAQIAVVALILGEIHRMIFITE